MRTQLRRLVPLVFAVFAALPCAQARANGEQDALRALLAEGPPSVAGERAARDASELRAFYAARGNRLAWREADRWSKQAAAAVSLLAAAADEGLDPARYAMPPLEPFHGRSGPPGPLGPRQIAATDARLTAAMLRYIHDIRTGQADPAQRDPELAVAAPTVDAAAWLAMGLEAPDFDAWLASLAPDWPAYRGLRDALPTFRRRAADGDWPLLPRGLNLEPGANDARVSIVRRQLARLGDLNAGDLDAGNLAGGESADTVYDPLLETAVLRFQRRHGLAGDGVVGEKTRAALNVAPRARADQIIVNMERLRWQPPLSEPRHLVVNVPAFDVVAVEDGKAFLHMPVIVGRPDRRTPMFDDRITAVTFLPSWTVPRKIARKDILPKVQRDPAFLERQRIKVFEDWGANACEVDPRTIDWTSISPQGLTHRFTQEPGPLNALGRIRFTLGNAFDIYLHDTPNKALFLKDRRAFSSGCIRVADAAALAEFALKGNLYWSRERIEQAMNGESTFVVDLAEPLAIQVTYRTAYIGSDGTMQFRNDIYGRDRALSRILGFGES
ncbi:MAG: L,D-transpeptidase family protein [Alphaproteobacteria bacterium]